jgi:hypothetical protein
MSSPSKRRGGRPPKPDPDFAAAETTAARLLADDAELQGTKRRDWRRAALGGMSATEAVAVAGTVRASRLKMGNRLGHLAARCAAEDGLSRESWIRALVAREVAARTGESYEELLQPLGLTSTRRTGGMTVSA